MTDNVDELFEEAYLSENLMPNWRIHCGMVLKTLTSGQTKAKFGRAREFFTRLAESLLTRKNDVVAYLSLSLLTDSFNFSLLQEECKTNLINVDLRLNTFMTIVTKLRHRVCTDKNERA